MLLLAGRKSSKAPLFICACGVNGAATKLCDVDRKIVVGVQSMMLNKYKVFVTRRPFLGIALTYGVLFLYFEVLFGFQNLLPSSAFGLFLFFGGAVGVFFVFFLAHIFGRRSR